MSLKAIHILAIYGASFIGRVRIGMMERWTDG
jgi:hypothetical protein